MPEEFLFFDSTRRDREQYPNPSDYVVPLAGLRTQQSNSTSVHKDGTTLQGSTAVSIILPESARVTITDYYATASIRIGVQTRIITAYNPATNVATVGVAFTVPTAGVPFILTIRGAGTVVDPVVGGVPYDSGTTGGGSLPAAVDLGGTASAVDNFYINSVLEIGGEFRSITAYDGTSNVATVAPAFTVPVAAVAWQVRFERPASTGSLSAVSSTLAVSLAPGTPQSIFGSLGKNVQYLRMTGGAASGDLRRIVGYGGVATNQVRVDTAFSALPAAADTYEILSLTRENALPMDYRGSVASQNQPVCYLVELKEITLPNQTVASGQGDNITSYPYVVVELESSDSSTQGAVYANTPVFSGPGAKFMVPIDDSTVVTEFIRLEHQRIAQTLSFKPNHGSFRITVRLPSGEVLAYTADDFSPSPPNRLLQITALFSFIRNL